MPMDTATVLVESSQFCFAPHAWNKAVAGPHTDSYVAAHIFEWMCLLKHQGCSGKHNPSKLCAALFRSMLGGHYSMHGESGLLLDAAIPDSGGKHPYSVWVAPKI